MPTVRRRHTLTETDEVARALHDAAKRWPDVSRSPATLLLRLVQEGHRTIAAQRAAEAARRRQAVERTAGALTGTYPAGYLSELRDEWPA